MSLQRPAICVISKWQYWDSNPRHPTFNIETSSLPPETLSARGADLVSLPVKSLAWLPLYLQDLLLTCHTPPQVQSFSHLGLWHQASSSPWGLDASCSYFLFPKLSSIPLANWLIPASRLGSGITSTRQRFLAPRNELTTPLRPLGQWKPNSQGILSVEQLQAIGIKLPALESQPRPLPAV
jgi:hypothetical protein